MRTVSVADNQSYLNKRKNVKMSAIYLEAARIVKGAINKQGSIKSLTYGGKVANAKAVYALVCEVLKCTHLASQTKY
jgi:hypothetical protein